MKRERYATVMFPFFYAFLPGAGKMPVWAWHGSGRIFRNAIQSTHLQKRLRNKEHTVSAGILERLFKIREHNSTVRMEILAGFTTFMAMSFIIFVNPSILAEAGMPADAAFVATILASVAGTLFMGLGVNLPIAMAPGMGINAFFVYTVVLSMGLSWQTALGCVVVSGFAFLILTVTHVRELIVRAVPLNLKLATVAGIGFFIAFIGLEGAGIVVNNEATLLSLGDMTRPETVLSCIGFLLMGVLMACRVRGAILIGILVTTVLGMIAGIGPMPHGLDEVVSFSVPSIAPVFMQLDIRGAIAYGLISVLFTMTMVDLFDSLSSIIGLAKKAGFIDKNNNIPKLHAVLLADSCSITLSGFLGTSGTTMYMESATGIAEGGRTGLTAVTVAALFLLSLFFAPLISVIQTYATAPALILVGCLMMQELSDINFRDLSEGLPAFLTIMAMPLTYSIATGFGVGFISYALLKTVCGRGREVGLTMWVIAVCFAINFVLR